MSTVWQWDWWLTAVGPNVVASLVCAIPALGLLIWRLHRCWARNHEGLRQRLEDVERRVIGGDD